MRNTALPDFSSLSRSLFIDELECIQSLAARVGFSPEQDALIASRARTLVESVRRNRRQRGGIDEFMEQYALSSEEGVLLMCLAEALLRIPDGHTADSLIADKIGGRDWKKYLGQSDSLFVNASTWGLMLTGKVIDLGTAGRDDLSGYLGRLVSRSGEPVIRQAMRQAMKIMGKQFVLGRTISEAISNAAPLEKKGYCFSYDMLGEAAMTALDAERYFQSYLGAMEAIGKAAPPHTQDDKIFHRPSLSVKLSALHPRYVERQSDLVFSELFPRIEALALRARTLGLGLTIDAEEVERLELSLNLFGKLCFSPSLMGWNGLGLAVQAYSKRAYPALEWLYALAQRTNRVFPVRLVKGAYWDTEIKRSQENGYPGYPVFTRKVSTDVSYLACARYLLEHRDVFFPQFATHNAHTVAAVSVMAGDDLRFEFQRLHGMGQPLYGDIVSGDSPIQAQPCRIYAPVGSHEDLLAYLVRRLLENGANSSFVNRLADDKAPVEEIIANPIEQLAALCEIPHPKIPLPGALFSDRRNSVGYPLWDTKTRHRLLSEVEKSLSSPFSGSGFGAASAGGTRQQQTITSPHDRSCVVGHAELARPEDIEGAIVATSEAFIEWDRLGGHARADILERAATLFEANTGAFLALLVRESGKILDNAVADLREAVDFLRYYAAQARREFSVCHVLPGPTGERNTLSLSGRGVFLCISPWNFPLAIFTGQVAAALASGNTVIAKPAEQTPLIASLAVSLLHQAGVAPEVLTLLLGDGPKIGGALLRDPRLGGVCFTGSNETATTIHRLLCEKPGPIIPFIAETGGINAMIVDSSALPEQVVRDVVASAFDSAGQRCSAARVLFIQEDIFPKVVAMLKGAMEALVIGDPLLYHTDVGPVIDAEAQGSLTQHKAKMTATALPLMDLPLPPTTRGGTFVSPAAYQINDLSMLTKEVFGPILHVLPFAAGTLPEVCQAINATGYGLTLGLHTRIAQTVEEVRRRVRVGNMYVNRTQIGAVVGVQPFGGEGLSGTGPKAGGPHYLHRFATERVLSVDTTASGGNAALLSMDSEDV